MIPRVRRQTAFGLVLVLSLGSASPARADDADALIDQGLELREHGKDAAALELFQRAFGTTPSPRAKAQIALAEQALGRWVDAERDLATALSSDADPWITKYKAALDGALTTVRTHLGDVIINGGVGGAAVKVDGVATGVLPSTAPLRLVVGTHTLEVTADGYYPFSQPVTVRADAPAAVSVEMQHVEAVHPPEVIAPPVVPLARQPEEKPVSHAQRVAGVVIAASSVAPLALALIGLGAHESEVSAYNADASCPGVSSPTQPAGCQGHIDAAGAWQAVSVVGFVATGALLVTGIIIALTAPHPHRPAIASYTISW